MAETEKKPRQSAKQKAKEAEIKARRVKGLELSLSGASCRTIANQIHLFEYAPNLFFESVSHVTIANDLNAITRELNEISQMTVEDLRRLELERLDAMQLQFWQLIYGERDPKDKKKWIQKPSIAAGKLLLVISKRRAELLGLNAPTHIEVTDPKARLAQLLGVSHEQLPDAGNA